VRRCLAVPYLRLARPRPPGPVDEKTCRWSQRTGSCLALLLRGGLGCLWFQLLAETSAKRGRVGPPSSWTMAPALQPPCRPFHAALGAWCTRKKGQARFPPMIQCQPTSGACWSAESLEHDMAPGTLSGFAALRCHGVHNGVRQPAPTTPMHISAVPVMSQPETRQEITPGSSSSSESNLTKSAAELPDADVSRANDHACRGEQKELGQKATKREAKRERAAAWLRDLVEVAAKRHGHQQPNTAPTARVPSTYRHGCSCHRSTDRPRGTLELVGSLHLAGPGDDP